MPPNNTKWILFPTLSIIAPKIGIENAITNIGTIIASPALKEVNPNISVT